MSYATQQNARDAVRALIQDGQPSYLPAPYGLVRLETLTDQIPATEDPDQVIFMVRWSEIPGGKNITVWPVPGTITAYVDGSTSPQTVDNGGVVDDLDQNGNFSLAAAPQLSLVVTYGWQLRQDGDIDQYLAQAIGWLNFWSDVTVIPDGLNNAVALYAASLAVQSMARQLRLPDVSAGEAKEDLSSLAKGYAQDAKDFMTKAESARADYYQGADSQKQPNATAVGLAYPRYQPRR